jgi:hypothetical protein
MIGLLLQGVDEREKRRFADRTQRVACAHIDFTLFILTVKIAQSIEQGRNSLDTFRETKSDGSITAHTPNRMLKLLDEIYNCGVFGTMIWHRL